MHVIGLGSNLLVRDGGVRGTVVVLHARLNELRLEQRDENDGLIYAQAGLACAKVARFAASARSGRRGISGGYSRHDRRGSGDERRMLRH